MKPGLAIGRYGFLNLKTLRLSPHDISTHKHVIGLTGQGKSKLLATMFVQLFRQGFGVSLLDPHSDLAEDVLSQIGQHEKLWFVDFKRTDRYLPFNVLQQPFPADRVAINVVDTFQRAWPQLAEGAAPHFENMLKASSMVLIEHGLPLTALFPLLTDRGYRDMLLETTSDPWVVHYFKYRFDHWGRETADKVESTLNKIFNLTFSTTLRYTLGQHENILDFRRIIDEGISVVYDLGGLDVDSQVFLGCLLTVGYEQAALSRSLPSRGFAGGSRREHHLIMDEFSRFSSKSEKAMTTMLSQTRKFGVFMTMAHQNFSPDDEQLRRSLGNALRIAFRVNREDALWLAPQFTSFEAETVKHEIEEEHAAASSHPLFTSIGEQYETMVVELSKELQPRQCYIRLHHEATKVTTIAVPPSPVTGETLTRIKEQYATSLMRHRDDVVPMVDGMTAIPKDEPPPRAA